MTAKRRMRVKRVWLVMSPLFLGVLTAQVLFGLGVFGSDKHIKAGLNCQDCHETATVAAGAKVGMPKCLTCHESYEKLAKRTEKMKLNPHIDYHLGVLDCNVCHHGHSADQNHCESCHK
jgi:hypothetical protein